MTEHKLIKLSKAKMIFPNKNTRMRAHDLMRLSITHSRQLTKKEQIELQDVAGEIRSGKLFGENTDLLITRKDKVMKIIPFK